MNNIISASFFDDQLDLESKLRLGPIVSFSKSRIHRLHDARRKTHDPPHTNTTHTDDRRHSRSSKTARCVALRWRYVCVYVASCKDRLRSIRRLKPPPSFDRPSQSPSSSPPPNTFNLPTQPRPPQKKRENTSNSPSRRGRRTERPYKALGKGGLASFSTSFCFIFWCFGCFRFWRRLGGTYVGI